MVLFVDDSLVRLDFNRNLAESDLAVTPVKLTHDAFGSLCITGNHGNGMTEINVSEGFVNAFIDGQVFGVIESA